VIHPNGGWWQSTKYTGYFAFEVEEYVSTNVTLNTPNFNQIFQSYDTQIFPLQRLFKSI
jgi:hypothetical protein